MQQTIIVQSNATLFAVDWQRKRFSSSIEKNNHRKFKEYRGSYYSARRLKAQNIFDYTYSNRLENRDFRPLH